MTLIDANVLLYAYHPQAEQHKRCRAWLEGAFSGPTPVGLAWMTIQAFIRISTHPRVFEQPLSTDEAAAIVSGWLELPSLVLVEAGDRHWAIFRKLLREGQVVGPLVTDAALAALALEHGAALCTTDRDFTRFPGLRLISPLAA